MTFCCRCSVLSTPCFSCGHAQISCWSIKYINNSLISLSLSKIKSESNIVNSVPFSAGSSQWGKKCAPGVSQQENTCRCGHAAALDMWKPEKKLSLGRVKINCEVAQMTQMFLLWKRSRDILAYNWVFRLVGFRVPTGLKWWQLGLAHRPHWWWTQAPRRGVCSARPSSPCPPMTALPLTPQTWWWSLQMTPL